MLSKDIESHVDHYHEFINQADHSTKLAFLDYDMGLFSIIKNPNEKLILDSLKMHKINRNSSRGREQIINYISNWTPAISKRVYNDILETCHNEPEFLDYIFIDLLSLPLSLHMLSLLRDTPKLKKSTRKKIMSHRNYFDPASLILNTISELLEK